MKKYLSFFLALALLLVSCGGGGAATMHLRKTEGTVGVSDGEGKGVSPKDNLGLYSGYQVETQEESYAWIDLDSVKLTKMDVESEIEITKDGKKLEIEVKSGSLFFNVTEPLDDDESMMIHASSMTVGIRGTCGWVSLSEDRDTLTVYLLEGEVECSNKDHTAIIFAGEKGTVPAAGKIMVADFTAAGVPEFVRLELENDETLVKAIETASGLDVLSPAGLIRLRDMYTYSRALCYDANGEWVAEIKYYPDEQGRIAKSVSTPVGEYNSMNDVVTTYEYNDAGTLAKETIDRAGNNSLVYYTVTEDTADHRTLHTETDTPREYIYYYDAQGRLTRMEDYMRGELYSEHTYTRDAAGRLIRVDSSNGAYTLYEYD